MNHLAFFSISNASLPAQKVGEFTGISIAFAALGRLTRGVTTGGATAGAAVCFILMLAGGFAAFWALFAVFALTWIATRVGYHRKQQIGAAEALAGRDALQVLANLGTAAACAVIYTRFPNSWLFAAMAAALAEPAADTISSEIGQAMGGTPRLITNWKGVDPGTNGAVTSIGSVAGMIAALVVAFVFLAFRDVGRFSFVVIAVSGIAGMIGDSILGATIEGRGPIGNNAVNFMSTVIAALIALLIVA